MTVRAAPNLGTAHAIDGGSGRARAGVTLSLAATLLTVLVGCGGAPRVPVGIAAPDAPTDDASAGGPSRIPDNGDRALLIGIGDYADPAIDDLPGIDLDVAIMRRVARRLGFTPAGIRVLEDDAATLGAVERTVREWLVDGVDADDRVLIYFSGHGTQLIDRDGDESDGRDEVLVMHDMRLSGGEITGALVDDRFHGLLAEIPATDVMLVVDACHSGSGYKSVRGELTGALGGVPKTHRFAGQSASGGGESFVTLEKGSVEMPFVAMMAADDHEVALATERGSTFTVGIERTIDASVAAGEAPTPREIVARVREFIKSEYASTPQTIYTPQIGGSEALIDTPVALGSANPLREQLERRVARLEPLSVRSSERVFPIGDRSLRITVEVPAAGFLNVVTVDPHGESRVLYPNRFDPDNAVTAGELSIPTSAMRFDLRADGPPGEHLVAAFWTPRPLDLREAGFGRRDREGVPLDPFASLSEYGTSRFVAVARESEKPPRAGGTTLRIVP